MSKGLWNYLATALAYGGIDASPMSSGEDTNIKKKNRKAYARYLTKSRENEIAEPKKDGANIRSRKTSRSGRRKKK